MRRLVVIAVLACAVSAVAVAPAGASCNPAVRWTGTTYLAAPDGLTVPRAGAALRGGTIPGCDDVVVVDAGGRPLQPVEPDRPVALRRVRGVPAQIAVIAGRALYVTPACLQRLEQRSRRSLRAACGSSSHR